MKDKLAHSDVLRCACANIRRADRIITQFYAEMLAPSRLHPTQFTLLSTLALAAPISINQLAERMGMDRTTLTRNLGSLTTQQLVNIETGEDRRQRLLHITTKGEQALNRALPLWEKAQAQIEQALGSARLNELLDQLAAAIAATRTPLLE